MTEESSKVTLRTITIPLDLLRKIEALRKFSDTPKGDQFIVRLLRLGLQEIQKDAIFQGYREKPWFCNRRVNKSDMVAGEQ
ncbi:hypothetical protein MUP05_08270 [Candidatus Bathyarchaeota archaeon]|nr:hypothetical protein [Candidatus Bathyarchaeota archaeon]